MINGIKPLPPKEDFDVAVDKLLENIHLDYVNWCGGKNSAYTIEPEKITLNPGRKFIKVISRRKNFRTKSIIFNIISLIIIKRMI